MDKVKARFIFLILIAFFLVGACYSQRGFAAEADQTVNQAVGLPAEECPKPESSFWPWKMLIRLDAWVKKNLW